MSKTTVLYLAPCGLNEGVGGSARLQNMVSVFVEAGFNIHLASYLPGDAFSTNRQVVTNRLDAFTVTVKRKAPKVLKATAILRIFFYGCMRARGCDFICAHAPGIASGFPAFLLATLFRKPLVIDHMDSRDADTPSFLYKWVLKKADMVFVISRFLEKETAELNCRKVVYVPIFIDTGFFQPDSQVRERTRHELGIGVNELVIGYAGSFWHGEGVGTLVNVFSKLLEKHQNVKLVIVGGRNVSNSDDIAGLIKARGLERKVIVLPPQPYHLMPNILSVFDIACAPKIDCPENRAANPVKIYEYMSMGLPVVTSAIGEVANVVEDGHDGFLFKPGDEMGLERVLHRLITNPKGIKEVGSEARKKILQQYTSQAMRDRIVTSISDMIRH